MTRQDLLNLAVENLMVARMERDRARRAYDVALAVQDESWLQQLLVVAARQGLSQELLTQGYIQVQARKAAADALKAADARFAGAMERVETCAWAVALEEQV